MPKAGVALWRSVRRFFSLLMTSELCCGHNENRDNRHDDTDSNDSRSRASFPAGQIACLVNQVHRAQPLDHGDRMLARSPWRW